MSRLVYFGYNPLGARLSRAKGTELLIRDLNTLYVEKLTLKVLTAELPK